MYFEERGSPSDDPVVLMPGFPDSATSGWGDLLPKALLQRKKRLVLLCMPGYESPQPSPLLATKWGFDFEDIVEMMHGTLDKLKLGKQHGKRFVLIAHDWGSLIAQFYVAKYPEDVSKLVLCDVGMKKKFASYWDFFTNVFYQLCFAIAYAVSQVLGKFAGELLFKGTLSFGLLQLIGPCPNDKLNIPAGDLSVRMCYPYYHLWRRILTSSLPKVHFPSCPLLFMYGKHKNCMFHDDDFLERIESTAGCSFEAMDAGHWFMIDDAEHTVKQVLAFI